MENKLTHTQNGFAFSSGRKFYANGYIGILEDNNKQLHVAHGYDGYIELETAEGKTLYSGDENSEMTDDERKELAAYMIELWTKFSNQ